MIPSKGQKIEVRLHNNVFFDAVVDTWTDEKSLLVLTDTGERVVIQKTLQDVLLFKIYKEKDEALQFEELVRQERTNQNLEHLSLTKDKMNTLERKELQSKFYEPKLKIESINSYGQPGFIPIARTTQHSGKEVERTDPKFNQELQNLFSQKY